MRVARIILTMLVCGSALSAFAIVHHASSAGHPGCHHSNPASDQQPACCQARHLSPMLLLSTTPSAPATIVTVKESEQNIVSPSAFVDASRSQPFRSPPGIFALRI